MSISEIKKFFDEINIRLDTLENESISEAVFALLQLVESLNKDNERLKTENQNLRDAINLLKGEQGKPAVLGKTKGKQGNISSDKERKKREIKKKSKSKAKKGKIEVNRKEIVSYSNSGVKFNNTNKHFYNLLFLLTSKI